MNNLPPDFAFLRLSVWFLSALCFSGSGHDRASFFAVANYSGMLESSLLKSGQWILSLKSGFAGAEHGCLRARPVLQVWHRKPKGMIRSVLRISGFGRLAVRHFKRCLDGQNNVGSNGCWLGFHSSRELKFHTGRSLGVMVLEAEPNDPSEQPTPPSSKLYQLADDIANLTLLEVADLNELLKQKLGMPDIPMAGMMSGGAQAAAAAPVEAEKPAEKTAFDIKLEKYEASAKIKIIKEVRAFTNLGLKEAKELVEKTPAILKKGATKEEATQIIEKITAAGGTAVME